MFCDHLIEGLPKGAISIEFFHNDTHYSPILQVRVFYPSQSQTSYIWHSL